MCYPKPGPRCAGHLRSHINALETRRAAAATAFIEGHTDDGADTLARELEHAREEYADTPTARRALIERIQSMPDGPEKSAAIDELEAATTRYRAKVAAYKHQQNTSKPPPLTVVGELEAHELSHLGIYTATLSDGRVVAHNVNGPNVTCPVCQAEPAKQANCRECAGRGKVDNIPFCPRNWDEVADGLFLGGHDNQPDGGDARVTDQFDVVVSLYSRDGFGPNDGIPHYTHTMIDGDLDPADHEHVHRLADHVVEAMEQHKRVLVRCQAGMNRSGLVSGLALVKQGWTTDEVLDKFRTARSEYVLFNQSFVDYLRTQEAELAGQRSRCTTCKGRRSFFGVTCEECDGKGYAASA